MKNLLSPNYKVYLLNYKKMFFFSEVTHTHKVLVLNIRKVALKERKKGYQYFFSFKQDRHIWYNKKSSKTAYKTISSIA